MPPQFDRPLRHLPRRPAPSMRPGQIVSRRTRLSATTPHPASRNAGSISSARVSASFTVPPGNRRDELWKAGARDHAARDRAGRTETRMSIADQVYEQVKALPDPLAREVLDFIAF